MKRSKFSEEQIMYALRQAEGGTPIGDVCRQLGIAEQTFYTWKKKYAHLGVSELRRLRQVEEENARLKRLVADLSLDKHMLSEVIAVIVRSLALYSLSETDYYRTLIIDEQIYHTWAAKLAEGRH